MNQMRAPAGLRAIPFVLSLPALAFAQVAPSNSSASAPSQETLFVRCQEKEKPKHVFSPVWLSEDEKWRAYVQVDVRGDLGCLHTTRLWVARVNSSYRVVYLMPPRFNAVANGMEILGWAKNSSIVLVKTEEWQWGSDATDTQQVLAIDAGTGVIYEPELDAMLRAHKGKQCSFRVIDAGFNDDKSINILIRAQFSSALDVGETEEDVPPARRCAHIEETWSFNFGTGEIKRLANTKPLQLFKKSLPNRRDH